MEENQSLYLLSLTRGRLVAVSLVVIGLFALFFFLGLAVGVKNAPSTASKPAIGGTNSLTDSSVELPMPGDAAEIPGPMPGDKPLPFTKHGSNHQPLPSEMHPTPMSSGAILALDRADGPGTPAKKTPITAAKKADSLKGNPGDQFYLQLVSTSDKAKADRLIATLGKHYKAYVRTKTEQSGRTLYMVRVGPYESKTKATTDLSGLRDKGYPDSYMVILKPGKTDGPVAAR